MNRDNMSIDEDEIDIKEVFYTLYRYRKMILSIVIVFALFSMYYAYFKPNIYKASATVEVGFSQRGGYGGNDMIAMATAGGASMGPDTEMEIIKSRNLAARVAKKVNFSHKYYTTRRFKEIELYKSAPLRVAMNKGYGISFLFYPINALTYRLVVEEREDKHGNLWSYDEVHKYDDEVHSEHFHLNIKRVKEASDEEYRFVIMDPKFMGSSVQGGISVTQASRYSAILYISYVDNVALRAKEAANALAQAYIAQSIEKKTQEATRTLTFVDKQLSRITENLKGSAIKLEEFKKSSNTVNLSVKAENIIRTMSEKEAKLAEMEIQQELLSSVLKKIQTNKHLESLALIGLDKSASGLSAMVKELQKAIIEKQVLREDYTELYPAVVKLRKTIKQLKNVIISSIENMEQSMKERKVLLKQALLKEQNLLNTLPADERMFGQLQRKFAVNEKIYSYLLEKRSETAIVKASTVSKNRILDEALLPNSPVKPKRQLIVLVGLLLGLILGIALAFLRAFLDDRIKGESDIRDLLEVPILGTIPNIIDSDDRIKVFDSPKSAVAEAFRNLRTNLQFMSEEQDVHTIAVISTVGGEGKTTICINLAAIMSMAGIKTVVLNLDMRKPTLHKKFNISNGKGMSTFLSGRATLADVIQKTSHENLDVITSGPVPPNPSELIQSPYMEKILSELKEQYDVIILDTPPVGLVTDARTLMHHSDTSIYVLRAEYSKKEYLRNVKELSHFKEISSLSILLNAVPLGKDGYGYGYGYGYYEEEK